MTVVGAVAMFVPLFAGLPAASAETTAPATSPGVTTYQAGKVQPLPAPVVMRVPTTFAVPAARVESGSSAAERFNAAAAVRARRYAQEQAYVKRFGAGRPVRLRARRY